MVTFREWQSNKTSRALFSLVEAKKAFTLALLTEPFIQLMTMKLLLVF